MAYYSFYFLVDETALMAYLRSGLSEEAVCTVTLPLARAYLRDPELLRRDNFG